MLEAAASLQGASQSLRFVLPLLDQSSLPSPSWPCGRLWLLRVGLYKLLRPKPLADDWIWIVDHTIQLGAEKCLVIVGIRQATLPYPRRSLRYEDLEPLALLPVTTSNGDVVYRQLEATCQRTGVPRQIVADAGSDLKRGIRNLRRAHPGQLLSTYDVKHKTAAVLKRELERDEAWQRFLQLAARTKQRVQQTALAFLAPPTQRSTARYMNVTPLVGWGQKTLSWLDRQPQGPAPSQEHDQTGARLQETVGWLVEFRAHLAEWADLMAIVDTMVQVIRTEGLSRNAWRSLRLRLAGTGQTDRTRRVQAELLEWFVREVRPTRWDERWVGTSEVLESVFGTFKHLERSQASSGFTSLLLCLPALVAPTTGPVIQQALEQVSTQQVLEWSREHIGRSLQAKRRQALSNGRE